MINIRISNHIDSIRRKQRRMFAEHIMERKAFERQIRRIKEGTQCTKTL